MTDRVTLVFPAGSVVTEIAPVLSIVMAAVAVLILLVAGMPSCQCHSNTPATSDVDRQRLEPTVNLDRVAG